MKMFQELPMSAVMFETIWQCFTVVDTGISYVTEVSSLL